MDIKEATRSYEHWLAGQTAIVKVDLTLKHKHMGSDPFTFLRASYYRWAQLYPELCALEADAPVVLSVGDLHVENFGTWRDREGRLVWGVNDFDEVYPLPYTNDLVRLAASARLAIKQDKLAISFKDACEAILEGYSAALKCGGRPFILEEENRELRKMALSDMRDPARYWAKLRALRQDRRVIPASAIQAIERNMPAAGLKQRYVRRIAGEGSLGRQRFTALAIYGGAQMAREAKAIVPSACVWSRGGGTSASYYGAALDGAVRSADPEVKVEGSWLVRRLAPDCSRIELSALPRVRHERLLLTAMGFETGNVHLSDEKMASAILADLERRPRKWLRRAAKRMTQAVRHDFKVWRQGR